MNESMKSVQNMLKNIDFGTHKNTDENEDKNLVEITDDDDIFDEDEDDEDEDAEFISSQIGFGYDRNPSFSSPRFRYAKNDENIFYVDADNETMLSAAVATAAPTFFFDNADNSLWKTSGFFRDYLSHDVIDFLPDNKNGAEWNPLAEIRIGEREEKDDIRAIARLVLSADDENAVLLLEGIIAHCMYHALTSNETACKIPTLSDVHSLLKDNVNGLENFLQSLSDCQALTPEEFLEQEYDAVLENNAFFADGVKKTCRKKHRNVFKEIYGDTVIDTSVFSTDLRLAPQAAFDIVVRRLKSYVADGKKIDWHDKEQPYYRLLTHPTVLRMAEKFLYVLEADERIKIANFVLERLEPYLIVNTEKSSFTLRSLFTPNRGENPLTCYYRNVQSSPVGRLFVGMALRYAADADPLRCNHPMILLNGFEFDDCTLDLLKRIGRNGIKVVVNIDGQKFPHLADNDDKDLLQMFNYKVVKTSAESAHLFVNDGDGLTEEAYIDIGNPFAHRDYFSKEIVAAFHVKDIIHFDDLFAAEKDWLKLREFERTK